MKKVNFLLSVFLCNNIEKHYISSSAVEQYIIIYYVDLRNQIDSVYWPVVDLGLAKGLDSKIETKRTFPLFFPVKLLARDQHAAEKAWRIVLS